MAELKEYNQKRDFGATLEPKGQSEPNITTQSALRYVIQRHWARREHYDFRLEWNGVLLSWAVPKGPSYNPAEKRLAVMVEDHPLEYRNFEGTIPQGEYGGGTVMLWDEGWWQPLGDVEQGRAKGSLKFLLKGARLKGKWALVKLAGSKDGKNNWLLLKEKDDYAKDIAGIEHFADSIRTGRTKEEIEQGATAKTISNPFDSASVQLAQLAATPPKEDGWVYEIKYDGYRILAYLEQGKVRLLSRNNNDLSHRFGNIVSALSSFFLAKRWCWTESWL